MGQQLYYIQNRNCVGNCMLWWANSSGYTADIEKAEVFTLEEAKKVTRRSIDRFWPKDKIDRVVKKHVDIQYTYEIESICADEA